MLTQGVQTICDLIFSINEVLGACKLRFSSYGYNSVVALSAHSCKAEIPRKLGKNGLEGECQAVTKFFSLFLGMISNTSVIHHQY